MSHPAYKFFNYDYDYDKVVKFSTLDDLMLMTVILFFSQSVGNALACATLENDGF